LLGTSFKLPPYPANLVPPLSTLPNPNYLFILTISVGTITIHPKVVHTFTVDAFTIAQSARMKATHLTSAKMHPFPQLNQND
jgi:hypothetical protein